VVREKGADLVPVMGGTYKDQWARRDGRWLFQRKELVHDIAGDMALKNSAQPFEAFWSHLPRWISRLRPWTGRSPC
jgi:hypothetical protein